MAYEVTATRRRPQHFEDLVGQEFVAETLKNSIKSGQIAHAYLFAGPRGCGKTSTARILAKALNCQSTGTPNDEPCGQCDSCRAITNSSSLDVIEIDGASNTSVNDVRQIKDEVMFPPNSARYKIYIIDEVHMLSTSAFNALLKTIEEPPPYVIFIFATTELQKVPATIKSRCQQFNFRLVPVEKVKNLLADACREMNIQSDAEALYWIAKESGGSIRDSYTLFDQVAAFSDGYITYEKIRDKLGLLGVDRLNSLFGFCAAGKTEEALNELDGFLESGISIEQLISNSCEYIRSLLLIKNGIRREALLGQSPERYSQDVLDSWNTVQTERALSLFLQLYRDIRYSLSPRYELELAFSRLCWLSQYVSPAEVKAEIDKAHALLENAPRPAQVNNSAGAQAVPSFGAMQTPSAPQPVTGEVQNAPAFTASAQQAEVSRQNEGAENASSVQIPAGMPHFSIFDGNGRNAQEATQAPSDESVQQEAAPPFPDGGAVPPEQAAAFSVAKPFSPPQENVSLPEYENGGEYSYAPDDSSDDDWSNTDVPPEDDGSFEDETDRSSSSSAEPYVPSDAADFTEEAPQRALTPEEIHESSVTFTASDGSSIQMGKLFGAVIAELSVNNTMLASALMQTGVWNLLGNKISTTIKTEYQKNYIGQNIPTIVAVLSKYCHEHMQFEIQYIEEKQEKSAVELPQQVKILCNAFKGTVVGT